jgi:hypothetical protein
LLIGWYARYLNYLCAMGRFQESVALVKGPIDIDPLSAGAHNELTGPNVETVTERNALEALAAR